MMDIDTVVARVRVLSSRSRIAVWNCVGYGMYPTDIATTLGLAASTVSYHLAILRNAGLVQVIQQGRKRQYKGTSEKWTVASETEIGAYVEEQRLIDPSQGFDQVDDIDKVSDDGGNFAGTLP
jgi:DNA-binding transcriptional ArsR family regulator